MKSERERHQGLRQTVRGPSETQSQVLVNVPETPPCLEPGRGVGIIHLHSSSTWAFSLL